MLNSGSVIEIAKVLHDIHRPEGGKGLSYSERRVRDQAQGLLANEIALACKCTVARAEMIINDALNSAANGDSIAPAPLKLLASHRAC
jgi:RNA polymerase-interacting CarD/CdnL/TRCF family regulator